MDEAMHHAHTVDIRDRENLNMFRDLGTPVRALRRNAVISVVVAVVIAGLGSTACSAPPPPEAWQTTLPFTGLTNPQGLAVNSAGDGYVVDCASGYHGAPSHLVKSSAGTNTQTVPALDGVHRPGAITVDTAGNVNVADYANRRIVRLAAGSNAQTVLPCPGLLLPVSVAVDAAGTVYVSDQERLQVVELAQR